MTAASNAVPAVDGHQLIVERAFDAPPELLFRAWTEPAAALHWFGPPSHPAVQIEMDARSGGAWRSRLRAADGSGEQQASGVYREVLAPARLVFTFAWDHADGSRSPETLVTITFAAQHGGTLMTLSQAPFPTADEADGHRHGWNGAFGRLAACVAEGVR